MIKGVKFRNNELRSVLIVAVWVHFSFALVSCGEHELAAGNAMESLRNAMGDHALVFQRMKGGLAELKTPPLSIAREGSILVVSVGRGQIAAFEAPMDNINETAYPQIGRAHAYTRWPNSGTALYALTDGRGGDDQVISVRTPPADEITMAAVEVFGSHVEDVSWNEDREPPIFWSLRRKLFSNRSMTSEPVETSGPATLIAFWWGDASSAHVKTAEPDQGFVVIDSLLEEGSLVQCAVAVKHVDQAGRYDVTWTATPIQGAQMWLVAVADHAN